MEEKLSNSTRSCVEIFINYLNKHIFWNAEKMN